MLAKVVVTINDDASGFRLDILTTHRLHRSPVVRSQPILTTHMDYVNSYPSLLQTISYTSSRTHTIREICAGVVKGAEKSGTALFRPENAGRVRVCPS